jgi:cation transport ATPase
MQCTVHCAAAGGKGDAPVEHTLAVPTMTSAAAAGRIESALLSLPGVAGVSTSLVTSRVKVLVLASSLASSSGSGSSSSSSVTAAASVGVRALLECVQGLGFEATVEKKASDVAMMGASQVRIIVVHSIICTCSVYACMQHVVYNSSSHCGRCVSAHEQIALYSDP